MKKPLLTITAFSFALASTGTHAAPVSTMATWDMYDPGNALIAVDTSMSGFVDQSAGTWSISSSNPFYGLHWTAHSGTLYSVGSYTIDTIEGGLMSFTVNPGQIGGHILLDWGATNNIDVVNVWDINPDGSLSYASVPGLVDGPFPGFRPSFYLASPGLVSTVPVPSAAWLFGSGLLGVIGMAKCKCKRGNQGQTPINPHR